MSRLIPSSMLPASHWGQRSQGLTLIELLIAMAIFAIMSASMFIAFDNVQKAKDVTDRASARLKQYQSAFNRIAQDLQQLYPRPARNEFGDLVFALEYTEGSDFSFSRTGWSRSSFFTKNPRSELQRVTYYLEDGKLMRAYWRTIDRPPQEQPVRTVLLDGVSELSFKFMYGNITDNQDPLNDIHNEWPPTQLRTAVQAGAGAANPFLPDRQYLILPNAIEITVTTDDLGQIYRSFMVASGAEYVFK